MVNHYEVHAILLDKEHQLQEAPKSNFGGIAHLFKLFTPQYLSYDDSLFLSQSFMYLLLAFAYR